MSPLTAHGAPGALSSTNSLTLTHARTHTHAHQSKGLPPKRFYDGESQDEIAFVKAASLVGYIFEGNEGDVYKLRTPYTPGMYVLSAGTPALLVCCH